MNKQSCSLYHVISGGGGHLKKPKSKHLQEFSCFDFFGAPTPPYLDFGVFRFLDC